MSHQLILEVPSDVYNPLAELAKSKGSTPEQLALESCCQLGDRCVHRQGAAEVERFRNQVIGARQADERTGHIERNDRDLQRPAAQSECAVEL